MAIECQTLIKLTAFMFPIRVMTECFNIFQRTAEYLILELKRTPLFFILFLRYLPNVSQWEKLGSGVEEISELRDWNFLKSNSKWDTRPPVRGTEGNSSGNNHAFSFWSTLKPTVMQVGESRSLPWHCSFSRCRDALVTLVSIWIKISLWHCKSVMANTYLYACHSHG